MKFILSILILALGFTAQADLKSSFLGMEKTYKGPFALNYMQGTLGRVAIRDSQVPPGDFQFQSAFRNDTAKALATQYSFYTGNLFTTNYYELMGTYVYNNPYGSFVLNNQALLAAGPQAIGQAASMVRSWVLEKHFVTFFPNNSFSNAFSLRGISGAEFELPYATYFFNFYLSSMNDDYQFLPAYLLAKQSPISASTSLDQARTLIAKIYDQMNLQFGEKDPGVARLYQLRNTIHNQLSQDVVGQIDDFMSKFPDIASYCGSDLNQVQKIINSYYNVNAQRVSDLAKIAGQKDIQAMADQIVKNGDNQDRILALSQLVANLRTNIGDASIVPYENKTATLALMFSASQFLNKEIISLRTVTSKGVVQAVVNLVYAEGFLIKDNWQYFTSEVNDAANVKAASAVFSDIADIANDTLAQAFKPAFDQWVSVEPKMQYFMDNTIKSSSLNTASILAKKVQ